MPNALPEFIVRKIYVKDSLKKQADGFVFALNNSFAPVVIHHFKILVDGTPVAPEKVSLTPAGQPTRGGDSISPENSVPFSINLPYSVAVAETPLPLKAITLLVDTRDAGEVELHIRLKEKSIKRESGYGWHPPAWIMPGMPAEAEIRAEAVVGEIHPFIYGQFIEHLERCVYGGLWTQDGSAVREDVFALVDALKMPLARYPAWNFASRYHWEDGIAPKSQRPPRFDAAWSAPESNQVGTDEYLALMRRLGAEPFLVVNDGSGTPEEAARWVEYCNASVGEQARRRAANGHAEPYGVKIWGLGNEVWGKWQIGATTAENYAARLKQFASAMRAVDPSLRLVAVGNTVASDRPDDPGRLWNAAVLRAAADVIDDLSFHLYQPDQEGWKDSYDIESLHYSVCAAPLAAERMIARMGKQIAEISPRKKIGVAFDEWNLWLAPPPQAGSMHQVIYTMRDALYGAGMLNAFQRQCNALSMANLAQLVNVLPLVVTDANRAYPTPMYWPFWMYKHMQSIALRTQVDVATFDAEAVGNNIPAEKGAPYLDLAATRSPDGKTLTLGLVNRHPWRKLALKVGLTGFAGLKPARTWLLAAENPLAANSFEQPGRVVARESALPELRNGKLLVNLPPASVLVVVLR
ncbi:MAG: hypothetical protein EHM81_01305 [Chloroflexi bacterium]|nr:MAG: hypothetical protein EHM81_01305 [Chloroflexota bacterium]